MYWLRCLVLALNLLNVCAQDGKKAKGLQLPALGRPFGLGDLYNQKTDRIILGPKLWKMDHLANYTQRVQRKTKFDIAASEKIVEKEKIFDIDASLKLSFMGGLIEVSGSAAYLDDRVSRSDTARVSLKFDSRTFARELKPEVFTHLDYPAVLDKVDATHVVVGIEYGAAAVFVFEKYVTKTEVKRNVEGQMHVSIRSIPSVEIDASARIKISSAERRNTENFRCRFHGDFVLDKHPGTYEEAVRVYKALPKMLGENYENSVPMTVWLYPINALPIDKESKILHEIRNSLVHRVTVQIENLNGFLIPCNDILASGVPDYHERIKLRIEAFKAGIQLYILLFKQNLAKLLPEVRSSGNSLLLSKMLADKEKSTFSDLSLTSWIEDAKEEVVVLSSTQSLPNLCRHNGEFTAFLLNEKRYTFALTMRLDVLVDSFIGDMHDYLDKAFNISASSSYKPYLGKTDKWWTDNTLISDLQRKKKSFENFYDLEKKKEEKHLKSDIQFLVREALLNEGGRRVTIELYEYAKLINANYEIPSDPGTPSKTVALHDSVDIMWQEPALGGCNVLYYEIDAYQLSTEGAKSSETSKKVKTVQTDTKIENMRVTGLKPEKVYYFIVSVYSILGKTAVSKQSNYIHTTPCPRGMYEVDDSCFSCNPGYYSDKPGMTSCLKCPRGTYCESFGSKECTRCPTGTYNSDNSCVECDPGYYSNEPGMTSCLKCSTGTYSDLFGSKACKRCPSGMYTTDTSCVECDPGYYSNKPGVTACLKCPIGTYSELFGGKECKLCPDNTTTIMSGAKEKSDCGGGLNSKIESMFDRAAKELSEEDEVLKVLINELETRIYNTFRFNGIYNQNETILVQNHDFRVDSAFKDKRWEDYAKGFGQPNSSEYWIGLRQLHFLTQTGKWNVVFQVVYDKNSNGRMDPKAGQVGQFEMKDFKVASEADNFRLSMGDAVEAMNMRLSLSNINSWYKNFMNGREFSTTDRGSDKGCASSRGGGWWFSSCGFICLNGQRSASGPYILHDGTQRLPAISSIWLKRM